MKHPNITFEVFSVSRFGDSIPTFRLAAIERVVGSFQEIRVQLMQEIVEYQICIILSRVLHPYEGW
jgi:hypothetical protein